VGHGCLDVLDAGIGGVLFGGWVVIVEIRRTVSVSSIYFDKTA
jgi:hypothetical protein